jgi:hypothetical protein
MHDWTTLELEKVNIEWFVHLKQLKEICACRVVKFTSTIHPKIDLAFTASIHRLAKELVLISNHEFPVPFSFHVRPSGLRFSSKWLIRLLMNTNIGGVGRRRTHAGSSCSLMGTGKCIVSSHSQIGKCRNSTSFTSWQRCQSNTADTQHELVALFRQ